MFQLNHKKYILLFTATLLLNSCQSSSSSSNNTINSNIGFFPNQKVSFVLLTNGESKDIEKQMAEWVNQF
jgi:hypothetical protein